MFSAKFDTSRNLLRILYAGKVGPEETQACLEQVKRLVADVKPGFCLLADFTGLSSMDSACAPSVAGIMDACNERGVATVLRVIPDPHKDIGLSILSFFHYGRGVQTATYETLADAEKGLEIS